MIYLVLLNVMIACIAVYFWKEMKHEKKRKERYKTAYREAKDEWAEQSNAVRKKGIECDQLEKENKKLKKDYDDICEQLGHLE